VLVADAPTGIGVWALPPTYGVTVCPVIGLSPSVVGASQVTRADAVAGAARTLDGAAGATAAVGVTAFDAADACPGPFALTASTRNV